MELTPVTDAATAKAFLETAAVINKDDPGWIQPLDKDVEAVFDPGKNKLFRQGSCARWILKDEEGRLAGRIAAFINKKYRNKGDEQPTGGIGFFECINSPDAAALLFDQAKAWLQEQGMEAMDGPINFGERLNWWGLLVEGFHEPLYCMNYNQPYYQTLFEEYGFRPFFNQICFALKVRNRLQDKFYERHARFAQDPDFSARMISKKELDKYALDFSTIYNKAWASHQGGKNLEPRQAVQMFRQMKPVIDERLVWFIYHKEQPIGCWLNLPDLNQWFKFLHGKFNLLAKLKFLYLKATRKSKRYVGLVFGIVPEFQGTGVDAFMIVEGANMMQQHTAYEDFEMQWIGDFNPKMINIAENLGTYRSRRLVTYRYLFDRSKPFKRHPMV
ncbi:hypothetical protein [Compostibacter hankyongensis]|uniref:GNAT family N-acetyltransferase n=1 Tax=Compostibacter hankyongensis TaxID=1007089 RepID=A0ABP8G7X7_9BACT